MVQELCLALQGGPYARFLGVDECPPEESSSSSLYRCISSHTTSGGVGGGGSGRARGAQETHTREQQQQQQQQQGSLLANWCAPADKTASRWSDLSDAECMGRALRLRAEALAALRTQNAHLRGSSSASDSGGGGGSGASAAAGRSWGSSGNSGGGGSSLATSTSSLDTGNTQSAVLLFKHIHKAGGSTLCELAQHNMVAEKAPLPGREGSWDTDCAPLEAFLGPHPAAVGSASAGGACSRGGGNTSGGGGSTPDCWQQQQLQQRWRRRLLVPWLGGACWLGFLSPPQLRALPYHFRPLTFLASEGPLPDALPLDTPRLAWVTQLRRPLDRVLSSYRWWQFMARPGGGWPAELWSECRAYVAPANASLAAWLEAYPDNWVTRELVGRSALYGAYGSSLLEGGGQRRPLGQADLHLAKQRLHYFAAVLLLEDWPGSMALMQQLFGWVGGVGGVQGGWGQRQG